MPPGVVECPVNKTPIFSWVQPEGVVNVWLTISLAGLAKYSSSVGNAPIAVFQTKSLPADWFLTYKYAFPPPVVVVENPLNEKVY